MATTQEQELLVSFSSWMDVNQKHLNNNTNVNISLLNELVAKGILSSEDKEDIMSQTTRTRKADKLFELLKPKVLQAFEIMGCFRNVLQEIPADILNSFLSRNKHLFHEVFLNHE